jgi:hypothetical protein
MHSHNEIIEMRRGLVPVCSDWRTVTWRCAVGRLCRDASRANSGYHQFCGRVVFGEKYPGAELVLQTLI